DKDIDSFVISGAGGFVGVAGAVSVWSVGSTFNRTYSDADGESSNSLSREKEDGTTDSADADAARQGQAASGKVSGDLNSFDSKVTREGKSNTSDERLADITKMGSQSLSANAPSQADVTGAIAAEVVTTPGTAAEIKAGAKVTAGDDIGVIADEKLEFDTRM